MTFLDCFMQFFPNLASGRLNALPNSVPTELINLNLKGRVVSTVTFLDRYMQYPKHGIRVVRMFCLT